MPWPLFIQKSFNNVNFPASENSWYGPWNTLLTSVLFPATEGFEVAPQGPDNSFGVGHCTVDFVILFLVSRNKVPVFFIEVKPPQHLDSIASREAADKQMRDRFRSLGEGLEISTLHGISAMGRKFALYTLTAASIDPQPIARDEATINDVAPKSRWVLDVLDADGEAELTRIVDEVKEMSANLLNEAEA
ncbi:hypothetical protein HGRIS_012248 [Hohenbuehelia grisea]|uniref:DUF4263 domain-containing protein n=1 Tax=Hohenbuehelia grisea TaxID=104357 RepID=A0ABR3IRP3_9AGAR